MSHLFQTEHDVKTRLVWIRMLKEGVQDGSSDDVINPRVCKN